MTRTERPVYEHAGMTIYHGIGIDIDRACCDTAIDRMAQDVLL